MHFAVLINVATIEQPIGPLSYPCRRDCDDSLLPKDEATAACSSQVSPRQNSVPHFPIRPRIAQTRSHCLLIFMTITTHVQQQYFHNDQELIRLEQTSMPVHSVTRRQGRPWTDVEHARFLEALELYPSGPWKTISDHVGTRTTRQTMTHAQKYREKIARRKKASMPSSYSSRRMSIDRQDYRKNMNVTIPGTILVPAPIASPCSPSLTTEQTTTDFSSELEIDDEELLMLLNAVATMSEEPIGEVDHELLPIEDIDA